MATSSKGRECGRFGVGWPVAVVVVSGFAVVCLASCGRGREAPAAEAIEFGVVVRVSSDSEVRKPFMREDIRVEFPDGEPDWSAKAPMSKRELVSVVRDAVRAERRFAEEISRLADPFSTPPSTVNERAERLRSPGYDTRSDIRSGPSFLRDLASDHPDAVVIDLSRLPSHGPEMGLAIRERLGTRHVPLVFVGGKSDKVTGVRKLLPDAVYTEWDAIAESLARAIDDPPGDPVVPDSVFAGYAGKPLHAKLGIKPNADVLLLNAPTDFNATLGDVPAGVRLYDDVGAPADLALWFVRSLDELDRGIGDTSRLADSAPLWIAWPKKASGVKTDVTQQRVRDAGLGIGRVDYKICSVDETWSALLFTRRRNS